jgi:hypothetical protein
VVYDALRHIVALRLGVVARKRNGLGISNRADAHKKAVQEIPGTTVNRWAKVWRP